MTPIDVEGVTSGPRLRYESDLWSENGDNSLA